MLMDVSLRNFQLQMEFSIIFINSITLFFKGKIAISKLPSSYTKDQYVQRILTFCSYGLSINTRINKKSSTKALQCAQLVVISQHECSENPLIICTKLLNNACLHDDYGGPLYITTNASISTAIGIASWSPVDEMKSNASRCMNGGDKIEFTAVVAPEQLSQFSFY
jgi:hypothetical protein